MRDVRIQVEQLSGVMSVNLDNPPRILGKIKNLAKDGSVTMELRRDKSGQTVLTYNLDKESTFCLATGYNIKLRMALIKRWKELEQQQAQPQVLTIDLMIEAYQGEKAKVLALTTQAEDDKPKIKFAEAMKGAEGLLSIGDVAKQLGFGRNRFFDKLREDGIILKAGRTATQRMIEVGYFSTITTKYSVGEDDFVRVKAMVTAKGLIWLENKYRK